MMDQLESEEAALEETESEDADDTDASSASGV